MMRALLGILPIAASPLVACEADDPKGTVFAEGEGAGGGEGEGEGGGEGDGDGEGEGEVACERPEGHYPDGWEACISDDGSYHLAGADIPSSAARAAAFEAIADRLWRQDGDPSAEDFALAEADYSESEGVGSRVARRYDSHVARPEGADCKADGAGATWPDHCVGPGRIEPLILAAFDAGIAENEPRENARRVEAGLLWFYYVSAYKEAVTCVAKPKDCDSSWAYYGGGKQRDEELLGLGGLVQAADGGTHDAAFDAHLGLRCWRDLDPAELSEDPQLHERALGQLEAALDRALVVVLRERLGLLDGAEAPEQWAFLEVLGPVADRALRLKDAGAADALRDGWAGGMEGFDAADARSSLDAVLPCPY